jgi:hypothetical protein
MDSRRLLASAVESAVFQSLCNARECNRVGDLPGEEKWFKQADKLERKFITQHGRHYAAFLGANA